MANTLKFGAGKWATGEGTALAYNDENDNFKPLPVTFTRASRATVVNQNGLVEEVNINDPRIEFQANAKGALLLEPSRTNLLTYSEFNSANPSNWQTGFGTGTFSYDLVSYKSRPALKQRQQTEGRSYKAQNVTVSTSTTYTLSFYIDKENSINIDDSDIVCAIISSDDIGFSSKNYGDADENNRINFTFTTDVDTSIQIRIGLGASGNQLGDKTLIFSMPQLEAGNYATSYIPTEGSAVTKTHDGNNLKFENLTRYGITSSNAYTIYFEFDNLEFGPSAGHFNYLYNGSGQHCMYVYGTTLAIHTDSGEAYSGFLGGFSDPTKGKFLVKYDGSTVKIYKNGSLNLTYTNPSSRWDNPDNYNFYLASATSKMRYQDIKIYDEALTDAQCISLTTI